MKLITTVFALFGIKDWSDIPIDDDSLLVKIREWTEKLRDMIDILTMSDDKKKECFCQELQNDEDIKEFIASIMKKVATEEDSAELLHELYEIFMKRAKPKQWKTINKLRSYLYSSLRWRLRDMKQIEDYKITDEPGGWTAATKLRYYRELKKIQRELTDELQREPVKNELFEKLGWGKQTWKKTLAVKEFALGKELDESIQDS